MKKAVLIIAIIIFLLIILVSIKNNIKTSTNETINTYIPQEEISDVQNRRTIVTLYFLDPNSNELVPEARGIDVKELMAKPYETILNLLIQGSDDVKIGKTIPEGTSVNSIKLEGEELIIDFDEMFLSQYERGSEKQMKMVYSIVNTFLELKEVSSVRFLVNGEKIEEMENPFVRLL